MALYIATFVTHFDCSGFTEQNKFSSLKNMGLTILLDLDLLFMILKSLGLFVPHSPIRISEYFVSVHSLVLSMDAIILFFELLSSVGTIGSTPD